MAHTSSETVPGRVRMRAARTARMALAQPAIGAHDPRWPAHCRITGCQVVRRMTLFGNRSPRIVVLRRKGRTFADAGGACRAVIGCALAGGAGGLRPAASGPAAGAQAVFLAVLRLIIRLARRAITLRSTHAGRHVTQPGRIGEAK